MIAISCLDFSRPGAAQARQLNLLKGLQARGIPIQLINPLRVPATIDGIPTIGLPSVVRRLPWRLALALALIPLLIGRQRRARSDILCFARDLQVLLPVLCIARLFRVRVIHEATEFPSETLPAGAYGRWSLQILERWAFKRVSAFLVISRALYAYIRGLAPHANILLVPSTAVYGQSTPTLQGPGFTFVYAGSLSARKDGVLILIEAFAILRRQHPAARLEIYGAGSADQQAAAERTIQHHGLAASVTLKGGVPQQQLAAILAGAGALVLARPYSKQAQGGFPTKLAEYLATGRPTVVTVTSDIGRYLQDGISAFLAPPNDVEGFADAMSRAIADRDEADRVGQAGAEAGRRYFDVEVAADRVAVWLSAGSGARR